VSDVSPAIIDRVVMMHMAYYGEHFGFGETFRETISKDLLTFSLNFPHVNCRLWLVVHEGEVLGSLAIDGTCLGGPRAQLRWFILDPACRSQGYGLKLIKEALGFCKAKGFREIHLWTFSDLHAARALYLRQGFRCVEESPGAQWGRQVLEQRYLLEL
jgi:GNAT superfamily N-acetyltransferase